MSAHLPPESQAELKKILNDALVSNNFLQYDPLENLV